MSLQQVVTNPPAFPFPKDQPRQCLGLSLVAQSIANTSLVKPLLAAHKRFVSQRQPELNQHFLG